MSVSACGILCESCPQHVDCSGGCQECGGKPFFLKDFGVEVCPIYDCAVVVKGYTTCGECADLPCQIFFDWKDPSMSDEAHQQSVDARAEALRNGTGISI